MTLSRWILHTSHFQKVIPMYVIDELDGREEVWVMQSEGFELVAISYGEGESLIPVIEEPTVQIVAE